MTSFVAALLLPAAWAASPEIVVVGMHVPGLIGQAPMEAADRLAKAVDETGKADGLAPAEVSKLIAGRESLILDTYALGPGRERLKEGTVLYERAQPDQAIPVLSDAVRLLENGLAVSTDSRDLLDALMTLGLAQVGMGEDEPSRQTFLRAVLLDPSRQLDTVRYSPDVVDVYESVRKEVNAETPGRLNLTASMDANVWIDGRAIGATPQRGLEVAPGEHYILVRAQNGASQYSAVEVRSGETKDIDALLQVRSIGTVAADAAGRSKQTRELYKGVGAYVGDAVVLLAGVTPDGKVGVQLYSPQSGNFSRALTAEAGSDPVGATLDLVPTVVGYLGENGDIRTDRVSPQVLSLDLGANEVLAGMLYDPPKATAVATDDRKGAPWYLWAGVGALVAGGGAATAVVLLNQPDDQTPANQNGTIQFGPLP